MLYAAPENLAYEVIINVTGLRVSCCSGAQLVESDGPPPAEVLAAERKRSHDIGDDAYEHRQACT
jgi:hypothetical protein